MRKEYIMNDPPIELGLVCRHCGCRHFAVVYTRAIGQGRIRRRRECRHCGGRMTTTETDNQPAELKPVAAIPIQTRKRKGK